MKKIVIDLFDLLHIMLIGTELIIFRIILNKQDYHEYVRDRINR